MATSSSAAAPPLADLGSLRFYSKNPKLFGIKFPARCMPNISRKTRVVAVFGITDIEGRAVPERDGWFMSEFYSFNHLLWNAAVVKQLWFTSCEPKDLIKKYAR
jgi:hypothetical protein